jgi:hypothetical protein
MPLSPEQGLGDCVLAKAELVWVSNRFHKEERPPPIYTLAEDIGIFGWIRWLSTRISTASEAVLPILHHRLCCQL